MVRFHGDKNLRSRYHFGISKVITSVFVIGGGTFAWIVGGGWTAAVAAIVVPWIVFNYRDSSDHLSPSHPSPQAVLQ